MVYISCSWHYLLISRLICAAFGFFSSEKQLNVTLISAAANAAAFMAEVGKNGNKHARWDKICDRFATYCDHGAGALIAAFAGVILMLIISAASISRLVQPNKCCSTTASPSVVPWKHTHVSRSPVIFLFFSYFFVSSWVCGVYLEWMWLIRLCKHLARLFFVKLSSYGLFLNQFSD